MDMKILLFVLLWTYYVQVQMERCSPCLCNPTFTAVVCEGKDVSIFPTLTLSVSIPQEFYEFIVYLFLKNWYFFLKIFILILIF